ncbi:MAG TPA: DUF983 domain-containing protein [Pseudolabrys sp.]|jgi:uncharacterized protein (DUF983 family)|nr:DUF983 domain-containing protein [Pseudolabrys sp.]
MIAGKAAQALANNELPTFGQAVWRGFRGRCPACGEGRIFRKFLKVNDACPACGEELHHHRADDFPAYLVIAITGHILVPIVLAVETDIAPPIMLSMTLWPSLAFIMALTLLQPVKGAVIAIQWFGGMHGFEAAKNARLAAAAADAG